MKKPILTALIYGAEYEGVVYKHKDYDIPCAVCWVHHSTTIMIPATHTCPAGWTTQYRGHLHGQFWKYHPSQYLCLDDKMEHNSNSRKDDDGCLFYTVGVMCVSLRCPPYDEKLVLTCVVCSK